MTKNNAVPVNNIATTNDKDSKDNNKETILSKSLLNKKDKISNKNQSLQQSVAVDSAADGLDKISPIPLIKRKSSNIDIVNGTITSNMLPMQNLPNGDGILLGDDKLTDSYNNSADLSESIDTSSDISGAQQQRPSIDKKSYKLQVSQV